LRKWPIRKCAGKATAAAYPPLATGGTLGILIPPSVPLVVYAILTEQNVAKMFAAAFIPGLIAMLGYMIVVFLVCRADQSLAPTLTRRSWHERLSALLGVWPIAAIFVAVFGGIYGGLFTPTEGAAVGTFGTMIAGLAGRELTLAGIGRSVLGAAETSAMVFMIFLGADMMNSALALTHMPALLASWVSALPVPPLAVVGTVLLFYVVLGCVMDELSMILLTIPVLFPAIMGLDLWGLAPEAKAIWFGILVLMVVSIGMLAPPVGLNVYVVNGIARDVPIGETYRGVVPFLISDVLRTLLLMFVPAVCLGLVGVLYK
jgi:C4-dicarboxylate transporter, DctM subunit